MKSEDAAEIVDLPVENTLLLYNGKKVTVTQEVTYRLQGYLKFLPHFLYRFFVKKTIIINWNLLEIFKTEPLPNISPCISRDMG